MKTKLHWLPIPADLDILPIDEQFLVIDKNATLFFAVYDGDDLLVDVPEDFEEDEIDIKYYATIRLPEGL
jgi:hypothetical protein